MQLVQFFIFSFFISLYHLPICSLVFVVVVLTSVSTNILFLPFSLLAFDVNSQASLFFVLLCDLLYSYVLLIHLIHRLFWFSMYHLFLLQDKKSFITLSFQIPLTCFFMVSDTGMHYLLYTIKTPHFAHRTCFFCVILRINYDNFSKQHLLLRHLMETQFVVRNWMLYVFFWVIPRHLNFICKRFGTPFSIFIGG
jgi:hypothetical protein